MLFYKEGVEGLPKSADVDTGGRPDQTERKDEYEEMFGPQPLIVRSFP